jgi:hypothetical protein
VRAREPLEVRDCAETAYPAVSKVPEVMLIVLFVAVSASPSVRTIPTPFTVSDENVLPAVMSVPVPVIVTVPLWEYVIPADSVTLPATEIEAEPVIVPVNPVQVIDFAPVLPVAIVTVPVETPSK